MATAPMRYGADNDAGSFLNPPTETILKSKNSQKATLVVKNERWVGTDPNNPEESPAGKGLVVFGGPVGVEATAEFDSNAVGVHGIARRYRGIGVHGEGETGVRGTSSIANGTGVAGTGTDGTGVAGTSTNGTGVAGTSTNGNGVVATSTYGNGVAATSDRGNGVQGRSFSENASGVYGENPGDGYGVAGRAWKDGTAILGDNPAGGNAGVFNGILLINGEMLTACGGFSIDAPHDARNRILNHSFVESPDMMNVYNGNIDTDADGNATVKLPVYFEALNRDFRYQFTVIGQFAQVIVAEEVRENQFSIKTDKPHVRVSWQVTGIRQDAWANAHRIEAEVEKLESERGKYLTPVEHGQPATAGIYYVEWPLPEQGEVKSAPNARGNSTEQS